MKNCCIPLTAVYLYLLYTSPMGVSEMRTQIYLSRDQHSELKRAAERRSVSMAEVIREALADYLDRQGTGAPQGSERTDPAWAVAELAERIGGSGDPEADASRVDEELYGPAGA